MKKKTICFYFYIFFIFRMKKKITYKNPLDQKLFVVIIIFTAFLCVLYAFNYLNISIMIELKNVLILLCKSCSLLPV